VSVISAACAITAGRHGDGAVRSAAAEGLGKSDAAAEGLGKSDAAAEAAGLGDGAGWDTAILLGRMTAATLAPRPAVGDQCRVIAWPHQRDGRKLTAGSALLGAAGEVLAVAGAVWLTVPRPGPEPDTKPDAEPDPKAAAAEAAPAAGGAR
jgi:hypothetical protein